MVARQRTGEETMWNRLAGKTVVIAGAAGGQGQAGAILFAREGANLALCDINDAGLDETARLVAAESPGVEVITRRVDMRSVDEIEAFISATTQQFEVIDVIYNN